MHLEQKREKKIIKFYCARIIITFRVVTRYLASLIFYKCIKVWYANIVWFPNMLAFHLCPHKNMIFSKFSVLFDALHKLFFTL